MEFSLGPVQQALEARLLALQTERFPARLWAHDDELWGGDPEHRAVAANRLGWLDAPRRLKPELAALRKPA